MPNAELTEIVVILDRSGSMNAIKRDMEGGYASFLAEQKRDPSPCVVSLYLFDDQYDVAYEEAPLATAPPLVLEPRGMTALLDAVGHTITRVGARLAKKPEPERPGKVVVMIITDGQENASREYTQARVKQLIEHQTSVYKWQFAFLGANLDSAREAQQLGMASAAVMDWMPSEAGVHNVYTSASNGVLAYRGARGANAVLQIQPAAPKKDRTP